MEPVCNTWSNWYFFLPTQQSQLRLLFVCKLEDYVTVCQAKNMISSKLILWGFVLVWHSLFPARCAHAARKLSSSVKNKSMWDKTARDNQGWISTKQFGGWPVIPSRMSFSGHLTLSNINPNRCRFHLVFSSPSCHMFHSDYQPLFPAAQFTNKARPKDYRHFQISATQARYLKG